MKHLLLCLFALLIADSLLAQTDISAYSLRHYTSENGLPQNTVKAIAPDDYGFIWLATESGLLRFDGTGFKQFDKSNTGLRTSRMLDIRRSPDGKTLLAISDAEELLLIAGGKAQKIARPYDEISLPNVRKLPQLRPLKGRYTPKANDSLFFRLDEDLGAQVAFQHGVIWCTEKKSYNYTSLPSIKNTDVIFPAEKAVYRGAHRLLGDTLQRITPQGIHRVALKGDFLKLPARYMLGNCFVENYSATGQTFLYTDQCLYQVSQLRDGSVNTRLLLSGFDFIRHQIYCVYYDSLYRRIFMGSHTEGLYILDRKEFRTAVYQGKNTYPMIDVVYDEAVLNDSTILTGNGTIYCTNPAVLPVYKKLPGYDNEHAHQMKPIFRSHDGNIWVCGPDKLYLFDALAAKRKKEWNCVSPMTLAETRDGRVWIDTWGHGLYVLDPYVSQPEPELFLPIRERIISMEQESDHVLWLATTGNLLRLNINTHHIDTIAGLADKMVRGLYIPRQGEVWICTYEDGLFLWQEKGLTHFPMQSYPHLKTVHKILEDAQGFFWISTNHGIYQARRADLLAYAHASGKKEEPFLFYYSKESGFLTNEFNGGSQYVGARLANGYFSLSSLNGVVFFRPSAVKAELPDSKVIIDKLEVDGKEVNTDAGRVALNRDFRTLRITPVSAYMGNPANLKYEFRLNNDTDWISAYNSVVTFTSLPSGNNKIFIRKRTGFDRNSYTGCLLVIYVPPAWWQTPWFFFSALAGLILLVWLITRMRVRYWKKRNRLLEATVEHRTHDLKNIIHDLERSENRLGEQLQFQRMLNENITHDITTPLKYLTIFTGDVLKKTDENNTAVRTDIEHIQQGANRIYEVVQNLGLYMRSRLSKNVSVTSFSMYQLTARKAALFAIAAAGRNNVIENQVAPDLFIHQNESLINIILHNLIDNAVKHTENGKIVISTTVENGNVLLSVSDNGKGMTPADVHAWNNYFREQQGDNHRPGGFGFLIIKEIIHLLKLEITVSASKGKGTTFRLTIPQHQLK
ncbi:ligand-binding sensor domain-containing protein [Chitinophagaceae bacterium MMS25-I14]